MMFPCDISDTIYGTAVVAHGLEVGVASTYANF